MVKSIVLAFLLFFSFNTKAQQNDEILVDEKDSISLYMFLLDDCPICIDYSSTLNQLFSNYGHRIGFMGYFPNFTSKPDKIEAFKSKFEIEFPTKTDYFKEESKKWEATVTPEVIVYNHAKDVVLYRGRVDNKFVRLGKRRNVVTVNDLANVLQSIVDEKKIKPYITKPIGCYISYNDKTSK